MEFEEAKVGDIIEIVDNNGFGGIPLGSIGEIVRTRDDSHGQYICIKWQGHMTEEMKEYNKNFGFKPRRFQLINIKCIYCGGLMESTGEFRVCTECFRKEER